MHISDSAASEILLDRTTICMQGYHRDAHPIHSEVPQHTTLKKVISRKVHAYEPTPTGK